MLEKLERIHVVGRGRRSEALSIYQDVWGREQEKQRADRRRDV